MAFGTRSVLMAVLAVCLPLAGCEDTDIPVEEASESGPSAEAATVNGQIIYVSDVELEARMKGLIKPGETLPPGSPEFDETLEELIKVKLLAMEALKRGLEEEPESRHRLETARDNVLGSILLDRIAAEEIDESAIRKMYDAQVALLEPRMEDEAQVRHILAPTREAIDSIAAELKAGADFAVLAARRSSDQMTRLDGGDLGYLAATEVSPELARIIRELPEGGVSRPFQDASGWRIVKIEDIRKRRPPSIDVLRETIERYLKTQQLETILKDLRADAEIVKRNPARSSRLDAPAAAPRAEPIAPKAPAPAAASTSEITILPTEPAPALPAPETRDPAPAPETPISPGAPQ